MSIFKVRVLSVVIAVSLVLALVVPCGHRAYAKPQKSKPAMTVVHSPNPCVPNVKIGDYTVEGHPYVWYYRTEVHNNLKVPICVVRFGVKHVENGEWVEGNIMGRDLGAKDFANWYGGEGVAKVPDGEWILPGQYAVCEPNWSAMDSPVGGIRDWWYIARDAKNNVYRADAIIKLLPAK